MVLEDIIEALNHYIFTERKNLDTNSRSHLVLHKSVTPAILRAYKKVSYKVWLVSKESKYNIFNFQQQERILTDSVKEQIESLDKQFLLEFISFIMKEDSNNKSVLKYIIYGEYPINTDE